MLKDKELEYSFWDYFNKFTHGTKTRIIVLGIASLFLGKDFDDERELVRTFYKVLRENIEKDSDKHEWVFNG